MNNWELENYIEKMRRTSDPCDGCANAARCAAEELACDAYWFSVSPGKRSRQEVKPEELSRHPSRTVYRFIFNGEKYA